MTSETLSRSDAQSFRRRVEYEDSLLNSRTGVVLTLNGLAAVAVGLKDLGDVRVVIAVLMIVIDLIWIPLSWQASEFIRALTSEIMRNKEVAPIDEQFRFKFQKGRRLSSTRFFAVTIPALLLVGWSLGLFYGAAFDFLERCTLSTSLNS